MEQETAACRRQIDEINFQIEAIAAQIRPLETARKRLQERLTELNIKARPVVYRILFEAEPTRPGYVPFTSHHGVFSTREIAARYLDGFSTRLSRHSGRAMIVAVASETLRSDWPESLDKPIRGHDYS